ncbi:MAG: DUF123 domain-containing protein [Candidatus Zixiibacteriota bacterium]
MAKGIYQLLIYLPKNAWIIIGKRGKFRFPKGYYIYTGSARNGLEKRIKRHLNKKKKHFWHIDYLLDSALIKKVFLFTNGKLVAKQKISSHTPHPNPLPQGVRGLHKFPPPLMGGGEREGDYVNLFNSFATDECDLNLKILEMPNAKIIMPRFGSSDCNCPAHLVFFEKMPKMKLI